MSLFLLFVLTTSTKFKEANLLLFKIVNLNSTEISVWLFIIWAYLLYRYYQFTSQTDKYDLVQGVDTCAQRYFEKTMPIGIFYSGSKTLQFDSKYFIKRSWLIDFRDIRKPDESLYELFRTDQYQCAEDLYDSGRANKEKFKKLILASDYQDPEIVICPVIDRRTEKLLNGHFIIYEKSKIKSIERKSEILAPFLQPIWLKYKLTYILAFFVILVFVITNLLEVTSHPWL